MRDILKLYSGTQSGTGVSPPKIPKKVVFLVRGQENKKFCLLLAFTRRKQIVSFWRLYVFIRYCSH